VLGPNEYVVLDTVLCIMFETGLAAAEVRRLTGALFQLVRGVAQVVAEAPEAARVTATGHRVVPGGTGRVLGRDRGFGEYSGPVNTLPSVPTPPAEDDGSLASPLGRAAALNVGFLAILWVVELINAATGRNLTQSGGILARDASSLVNILTAPFVHGNLDHLMANALPLFSLGLIAAIPSPKRFLWMTLVVIIVGGIGIWLTSPPGTVTIGASGVVFGYFSYLLLRGLVDRRPADVLVSIGIAIAYGSYMWSAVGIGVTGVSWQGHVSGLVGGIVAALVVRTPKRRKPATEPLPELPPAV